MGDSQSKVVYTVLGEIKDYKMKEGENPVVGQFGELLRVSEVERVNDK